MGWDEVKELGGMFLIVILVISIFLMIIFGVIGISDRVIQYNQCQSFQTMNIDYQFKYNFWTGCMIKSPSGLWVNSSDYVKYYNIQINP